MKEKRIQRGYVFRKGRSWFVRYADDVMQKDGTVKRRLLCKKLEAPFCEQYRTKKSVQTFADEILRPINSGTVTAQSTMSVADFIERTHFPAIQGKKRASTLKGYRGMFHLHMKGRLGAISLRDFRTVHGERLLADIARQTRTKSGEPLTRNSLSRMKAFLSGVFKEAKRLGALDNSNPIRDVSVPQGAEAHETHAYGLEEIKQILGLLSEPTKTIVLTAALSGLRKGEIRGLQWSDFSGTELTVRRAMWNSITNEPKTRHSKAPIPAVKMLAEALEKHRERMGKLAVGPIFQAGNGKPLNLDNLARRVIMPALNRCVICGLRELDHKTDGHMFERDEAIPRWHGWHAFRRGLATNLHSLGVDDRTIQAILRHSNIAITMRHYVKSVPESQVSAMNLIGIEMEKKLACNELATNQAVRVN